MMWFNLQACGSPPRKGISVQAEDVGEEAVSQGLLIRQRDGSYLLLG